MQNESKNERKIDGKNEGKIEGKNESIIEGKNERKIDGKNEGKFKVKNQSKIDRKKGKNCRLAIAAFIVILLVVILQNLSPQANVPEENNAVKALEMTQEEGTWPKTEEDAESADAKVAADTEDITEPEMSMPTEKAEGEKRPGQTEEYAEPDAPGQEEKEQTKEPEEPGAPGQEEKGQTEEPAEPDAPGQEEKEQTKEPEEPGAPGQEEKGQTEEPAEPGASSQIPQTEENNAAEKQDAIENLEVTISENSIILQMYDETTLVQEEQITSDSISCNLISRQKTGFLFDGYCYGELRAMDSAGVFTAEFTELLQKELSGNVLELRPLWIPKTYKVYYGKDEDRDGYPDGQMMVTYGESYEDLTPLPDRGLSVFKGYYFGSKQVFSRKGKAKENWLIDSDEDIILKAKYYRPEGNDLYGEKDGEKDEDKEESSKEKSENNSPQMIADAGGSQTPESLQEQESSKESDLNSNSAENIINNTAETEEGNIDHTDAEIDAGTIESNAADNTEVNIPGNAVGSAEEVAARNEAEDTDNVSSGSIGNYIAGNSDEHALDHAVYHAEVTEKQKEPGYQNKDDESPLHLRAEDKEENIAEFIAQNDAGKEQKRSLNPKIIRDKYKKWKINAENYLEEKGIPKEVLTISAYMVMSTVILAAMFLCLYLMQNSAILYTNNVTGKRKRIAYILLQKKQEGYQLSISKKQLGESETGNYVLSLPRHVVRSKKNDRLVISIPNKKWCELPAKEISFLA